MAFELTPRQTRTVAAAATTVAAAVIVTAAGLLGWLIVLFVRTFSGVFLPLVVGAVAALVFRPYYDWLRGPGRMPVAGAVAAVFLSALVPLAAFIAFFGHLAARQLLGLAEQAPELWEQTRTLTEAMLPRVGVVLDTWGLGELLREIVTAQQTTVVEWLRAVGSQAVAAGFGFARGFSALLSWAITPIYFAYFLTATGIRFDADRLLPFLKPDTRGDVEYLLHEFVDILVGFFRGQLLIAFLQGLLFAVGFSLIGLRYGVRHRHGIGDAQHRSVPRQHGRARRRPSHRFLPGGRRPEYLLAPAGGVRRRAAVRGLVPDPEDHGQPYRPPLHGDRRGDSVLGHGVRQRPGTGPGDSADRLPGVALALSAREEVHSRGPLLTGAACTAGH